METIKNYTDLPQSKKLAEFLSIESSDMSYDWFVIGKEYSSIPQCRKSIDDELPCWSLSALLGLMPTDDKKDEYYVVAESHSDYHTVSYRNCWDGCIHSEYSEESLLDAAFEMVVWLKENNKI